MTNFYKIFVMTCVSSEIVRLIMRKRDKNGARYSDLLQMIGIETLEPFCIGHHLKVRKNFFSRQFGVVRISHWFVLIIVPHYTLLLFWQRNDIFWRVLSIKKEDKFFHIPWSSWSSYSIEVILIYCYSYCVWIWLWRLI